MKMLKNIVTVLFLIGIGNSLNAMRRGNPIEKVGVYMGGHGGRYSNLQYLEPQEFYEIERDRAVAHFRELFESFKNEEESIYYAYSSFMNLGLSGIPMWDAHEIVRKEIISSEEVIDYINSEKELLDKIVMKLNEKYDDLGVVSYLIEDDYWIESGRRLNYLQEIALEEYLEERFEGIKPVRPRDDADLADELGLEYDDEVSFSD